MKRSAASLLFICALSTAIAACHPRNRDEHAARTEENRGGHGLKRVCAGDIAKYCQNEDRKRRCLRQNEDKLSADCKAALEEALARKRNKDKTDTGGKSDEDE